LERSVDPDEVPSMRLGTEPSFFPRARSSSTPYQVPYLNTAGEEDRVGGCGVGLDAHVNCGEWVCKIQIFAACARERKAKDQ
jgi:hypothetical protein